MSYSGAGIYENTGAKMYNFSVIDLLKTMLNDNAYENKEVVQFDNGNRLIELNYKFNRNDRLDLVKFYINPDSDESLKIRLVDKKFLKEHDDRHTEEDKIYIVGGDNVDVVKIVRSIFRVDGEYILKEQYYNKKINKGNKNIMKDDNVVGEDELEEFVNEKVELNFDSLKRLLEFKVPYPDDWVIDEIECNVEDNVFLVGEQDVEDLHGGGVISGTSGNIMPVKYRDIVENGNYVIRASEFPGNIDGMSSVSFKVQVPTDVNMSLEPNLLNYVENQPVTSNGTYHLPEIPNGYDGYSGASVEIQVPTSNLTLTQVNNNPWATISADTNEQLVALPGLAPGYDAYAPGTKVKVNLSGLPELNQTVTGYGVHNIVIPNGKAGVKGGKITVEPNIFETEKPQIVTTTGIHSFSVPAGYDGQDEVLINVSIDSNPSYVNLHEITLMNLNDEKSVEVNNAGFEYSSTGIDDSSIDLDTLKGIIILNVDPLNNSLIRFTIFYNNESDDFAPKIIHDEEIGLSVPPDSYYALIDGETDYYVAVLKDSEGNEINRIYLEPLSYKKNNQFVNAQHYKGVGSVNMRYVEIETFGLICEDNHPVEEEP